MTMYDLLPAVHRSRDAELGFPLRALLGVLEEDLGRLRGEADALFDGWFAETCAEDRLPGLAELLGLTLGGAARPRALVANTIGYRRRKGTPETLARLARDVTGRPVQVVENFRMLATTQRLGHPRPGHARTPDLRDLPRLARIGTAGDTVPRTADVRGHPNLGMIALHVPRLEAYPCTGVDARAVDRAAGRWTFDPAGRDRPLFARERLSRYALHRDLAGGGTPALTVALDGAPADLISADLISADLRAWGRPARGIAVDPVLGRLTVPAGVAPERIVVGYAYGAPGDLGAGPYDHREVRAAALAAPWPAEPDQQATVSRNRPAEATFGTVRDAVAAWNSDAEPARTGLIEIRDSATYPGALRIVIPPGARLLLAAAPGTRPHLIGGLEVVAPGGPSATPAELMLDGLSVEGGISTAAGDLDSLVLTCCSLHGELNARDNPRLSVRLQRTVGTALRLREVPGLELIETLVSAEVDAEPADLTTEASTVLGPTTVRTLTGSDSILAGPVTVTWRQQGYLRYSSAPPGSRLPRRYNCPPAGVRPAFATRDPGDPDFGRLAANCPPEIAAGAEDGSELGVFRFLRRPQRLAELTAHLDDYLRFGLAARIVDAR
ncbi:MAG: hypothetical protein ABW000_15470 [Actinoplanes sp.]